MEKINFVNGQSPYISATNLNNLQDNVENAISNSEYGVTQLYGKINQKGTFTLNDNVSNYDEIRIWATRNAYDHRLICNTYRHLLQSELVQFIMYEPTDADINLKIYGNVIDTTTCENFGVENRHIYCVEGIKYHKK